MRKIIAGEVRRVHIKKGTQKGKGVWRGKLELRGGREGQEEMIPIACPLKEDMSALLLHLIATTEAGIDLTHLWHLIPKPIMRCLVIPTLKNCLIFYSVLFLHFS